jgi:hypothetical protein
MDPDFAPQYSPKERRRRLLVHAVLGALMAGAVYWWVLPRVSALTADAPCETIFGVPASTVLIHGAFVGAPLAAAVLIVVLTGRWSIETIATRQYPPPGRKVYRRMKVKRGWQAVTFALIPAMFITYLCVLAAQGLPRAAQMAQTMQRSAECHVSSDIESTPPRAPSRRDSNGTENRRPSR